MSYRTHYVSLILIPLIALFSVQAAAIHAGNTTLEEYVKLDDGVFAYQQVMAIPQAGFTVYVYKLTSQKWRAESEVDRTIWEHQLTLVVPDNLAGNTAMLFILGGRNSASYLTPDPAELELLATFAMFTSSIAAQVSQVPNQPLVFADEPQIARTEDDLVAYSWDTAMGTGDYTWAAYLPMAKSVIKAMDAIQLAASDLNLSQTPDEFVLTGFSKRGGITWLSAAVDSRVIAIAPGVFDTLNLAASIENHRLTYGDFGEVYTNYIIRNVLDRLRTREGQELSDVVDPYVYRNQISIPKYIINVSGDQFFPPDGSRFYIDDLSGESLLRYVPNTDHSGSNGGFENAMSGLLAWYQRIVLNIPRPSLSWQKNDANLLSITISDPSATAILWSANNPDVQDFRMHTFGPNWQATPVSINSDGTLAIPLAVPETGWSAYFVEVSFQGVAGFPDRYSTPVFILPDTKPFTLAQPRFNPKPLSEWQDILSAIVNGGLENPALVDTFPIRAIGDETISTINAAYALLTEANVTNKIQAQQTCLVTRLNIKDGQLDWYSRPGRYGSAFLWELWNLADLLYRVKLYTLSGFACNTLNY
jgi:PhoPQ-activated pathogenicity-related protein